jgi:acetyltransferase-like isoleucine patch superfamily enzyme
LPQTINNILRKILRMRKELGMGFYVTDFIFRKIFRQNSDTQWAVHHTSTLHAPYNIKRGIHVFPGDSPGVYINALNGIEIGDYTNIGPHVGLISANHNFVNNEIANKAHPIIIGKHCWIGKGATLLPEVVLGDFTIVGAGAVVSKSFAEGYCVIAGNPAIKIKDLNKQECLNFATTKQYN